MLPQGGLQTEPGGRQGSVAGRRRSERSPSSDLSAPAASFRSGPILALVAAAERSNPALPRRLRLPLLPAPEVTPGWQAWTLGPKAVHAAPVEFKDRVPVPWGNSSTADPGSELWPCGCWKVTRCPTNLIFWVSEWFPLGLSRCLSGAKSPPHTALPLHRFFQRQFTATRGFRRSSLRGLPPFVLLLLRRRSSPERSRRTGRSAN
ncbi:uncharacterized protein LOC117064474 [Trachypithecus francoisi]|uniref:uncharacterized protein LOC117064474 n=1 Tax=Trachypithecus francoisi TaxID=54180 RepID=UPI00141BEFE8|nr:uncharacterized protein LOC117064474 [Trachypithecus francoisi]